MLITLGLFVWTFSDLVGLVVLALIAVAAVIAGICYAIAWAYKGARRMFFGRVR